MRWRAGANDDAVGDTARVTGRTLFRTFPNDTSFSNPYTIHPHGRATTTTRVAVLGVWRIGLVSEYTHLYTTHHTSDTLRN